MGTTKDDRLRIAFFGTPEFAVQSLSKLLRESWLEVAAVYTQPDRPVGRGRRLQPTAVKRTAESAGLAVRQPDSLSTLEVVEEIRQLEADLLVVVAYGGILPAEILRSARYGALNVHASLLPKYRGAAPIQRAIQNGERVTGVTIMHMDTGMDTGPIALQRALAIGIHDTAESIHDELAEMGGELLIAACRRLLEGSLPCIEQDPERASNAPKLRKEEGRIDWNRQAIEVHDHIRAMHPWPGAFFDWSPEGAAQPLRLHIFPGEPGPEKEKHIQTGSLEFEPESQSLRVACRDRYYLVSRLKPASGKPMPARAFYCGYLQAGRGEC